ncbi:MAG TPA: NUDIX domain-containing protein [Chlamydiales bacterium]|nr:NUDIX domain-containing protein [Chlamydiales bacterium]
MRKDESFGVIPLQRREGNWYVFLIQHRKAGYWGLPKGHKEGEESPLVSAFRELKEETNLECERLLREEPFAEEYKFFIEGKPVFKTVLYFAAEVKGTAVLQKEEINDGVWVPFPDAFEKITHSEGKAILSEVILLLENVED